ncbi:LysR family transcriptional regulator [Chitinibacter sp. S2-10]|uniref:LysR family transcriptional regulator n=1 Tax=Chitinibacter sp. S2-10 TaxID=3373597 RepID=UPI00397787AC
MSFSFRNVRYFIAVAEAESITGATQTLNISQSVITEAIKTLEAELGVSLFQRHARGMVLTHAGHQFLRHAHEILAVVRNAQQALSARPDAMAGQLNLGVTGLMSGYFLPYLLDRFRRTFPKIDVRLVEDQRGFLEHLLVNGELDLAIVLASNVENRLALEVEVLQETPWRVWLPSNHSLLELGSINLNEIANEAMIMLKLDELDDNTSAFWRAAGLNPKVAMRTQSVEAVRSLVATGAGLSILPEMLYRPWSLDGDRLEMRAIQQEMPVLEIGVAWRRGSKLSEAAQHFLIVAREFARSHRRQSL